MFSHPESRNGAWQTRANDVGILQNGPIQVLVKNESEMFLQRLEVLRWIKRQ